MVRRFVDAVDQIVGKNIRVLRLHRDMSQSDLAKQIGVTFQQVQKYENGTNRVGGGRLFRIASIFQVPIDALFDGAQPIACDNVRSSPVAMLADPLVLRAVRAMFELKDIRLRRSITELVEQIAALSNDANEAKRSCSSPLSVGKTA